MFDRSIAPKPGDNPRTTAARQRLAEAVEAVMYADLRGRDEWNIVIDAPLKDILEARATLLRLHTTMHKTLPFGSREGTPKDWSWWPTCSGQVCGRGLLNKFPEEFPASIIKAFKQAEERSGMDAMKFLNAMVLPRRRRRKGIKGVFFAKDA
jgi:hypothetical protein